MGLVVDKTEGGWQLGQKAERYQQCNGLVIIIDLLRLSELILNILK